jgi:hypothetical protein
MNIPINTIVKFIKTLYNPEDIAVSLVSHTDKNGINKPEYYIYVYFDFIDEKYLKNPQFINPVKNKEIHFRLEIRNNVDSYFGIKTSGMPLKSFGPFEYHGLTIEVKSYEPEYPPLPID